MNRLYGLLLSQTISLSGGDYTLSTSETFNRDLLSEMVQLNKGHGRKCLSLFSRRLSFILRNLAAAPLPLAPLAWICGDLHIESFGSYQGDSILVYFDLNDFDEATLASCS